MTAADERNNEKAKKVYVGVIILLIVIFAGLFIYSLNKVLAMEGAFPEMFGELTESVIPEPETPEDALAVLNDALDLAEEKKPQLSVGRSFSVDTDSIASENGDGFVTVLSYIADDMEGALEDSYESSSTAFYEDISGVLVRPEITARDITDFTCSYRYYRCASCGEISDTPLDNCVLCGYAFPYTLKYRDEYSCELTLKPSDGIAALYDNKTPEEVISMLSGGLEDFAGIDGLDIGYESYVISFRVDRIHGRLNYLEYTKVMNAAADITARGGYASLGEMSATAQVTERNRFSFTWPALILDNHEMTVEPGSSDNLLATLVCDDPTAYEVTWTTSDENIVSVDDEGYFKGKKEGEGKTAVITATYEFGGIRYSDSCEVTVRVPAESMKLSKGRLNMTAGESFTLEAKVAPAKATFKNVYAWISTDESVATVDENGIVTAIGAGSAKIVAYSADGFFKSTCEVTVE